MALRLLLFIFICGLAVTSLKGIIANLSKAEATGTRLFQKCKGGNLILNEPNLQITVLHTFVFRGDQTLASTSIPATGMFEGRLMVEKDGRVTLNNLTSDDFGTYQVEINLAEKKLINTIRLVIKEPPKAVNGKLFVMKKVLSESSSNRLTCGTFTTLGFPPVSAVWTDPAGRKLSSDGLEDQYFYLDLPADTAYPADYSCQLDCRAPDFCCLDDQSPLRSRSHLQVCTEERNTQKKVAVTTIQSVSVDTFSQPQQRVSDFTWTMHNLQELECSQTAVAAIAHLTNLQSKSDICLNKVENLEKRLKIILENVRNVSEDSRLQLNQDLAKICRTIVETEGSFETKISQSLKRVETEMQDIAKAVETEIKSGLDNLQQTIGNAISRLEGKFDQLISDLRNSVDVNRENASQELKNLRYSTDTRMSAFEEKLPAKEGIFMYQLDNISQIVERIRSHQLREAERRCLQKDGYMWQLESCLKVSSYEANYTAAQVVCREDGAHLFDLKLPDLDVERLRLAVIESKNNGTLHHGYFMVGAIDVNSNHSFLWTDGTPLPLSSSLWGPKQPNPDKLEDCVWAGITLPHVLLHDFSCNSPAYFICQYDI